MKYRVFSVFVLEVIRTELYRTWRNGTGSDLAILGRHKHGKNEAK